MLRGAFDLTIIGGQLQQSSRVGQGKGSLDVFGAHLRVCREAGHRLDGGQTERLAEALVGVDHAVRLREPPDRLAARGGADDPYLVAVREGLALLEVVRLVGDAGVADEVESHARVAAGADGQVRPLDRRESCQEEEAVGPRHARRLVELGVDAVVGDAGLAGVQRHEVRRLILGNAHEARQLDGG